MTTHETIDIAEPRAKKLHRMLRLQLFLLVQAVIECALIEEVFIKPGPDALIDPTSDKERLDNPFTFDTRAEPSRRTAIELAWRNVQEMTSEIVKLGCVLDEAQALVPSDPHAALRALARAQVDYEHAVEDYGNASEQYRRLDVISSRERLAAVARLVAQGKSYSAAKDAASDDEKYCEYKDRLNALAIERDDCENIMRIQRERVATLRTIYEACVTLPAPRYVDELRRLDAQLGTSRSVEQLARDMLSRAGVENAADLPSSNLVEIANLINDAYRPVSGVAEAMLPALRDSAGRVVFGRDGGVRDPIR